MFNELKKIKAFSLIEIAIVITVIGVILGGMLDVMTNTQQKRKLQDNNDILDKVQNALYSYKYSNNMMLPCPAPNVNGYAYTLTSGANQGNCPQTYGLVPYALLGLPQDFMYDAWGRLISYVIVPNGCAYFSANNIGYNIKYHFYEQYPNCNVNSSNPGFTLTSGASNGNTVFSSNNVYLLISHGKSGYGAMTLDASGNISGQYKPTGFNTTDKVNNAKYYGGNTTSFVYRAVNDTAANYFDDVIRADDFMAIIRKGRHILGSYQYASNAGASSYITDPICNYVGNIFTASSFSTYTTNYYSTICDYNAQCANILGDFGFTSTGSNLTSLGIYQYSSSDLEMGQSMYSFLYAWCVYDKSQ